MRRVYSDDLRFRIVRAVEEGMSQPQAAARFAVGLASVKRYLRQWRVTGALDTRRTPADPALSRAACQGCLPGAERPIQPFDICRLDRPIAQQPRRPAARAMGEAARHPDDPPVCSLFDHLSDHQPRPFDQSAPSPFPVARLGGARQPRDLLDRGREAIDADHERRGQRTRPH